MRAVLLALVCAGCGGAPTIQIPADWTPIANAPELGGERVIDEFGRADALSDVLFSIDNTGSMMDEQEQLIDSFDDLIQPILDANTDYHIGVLSGGGAIPVDGKLQLTTVGKKWIDRSSTDPVTEFSILANLGASGGGEESIRAFVTALEELRESYNRGFRRDGADLHLVVITDDNDRSNPELASTDDLIRILRQERTDLNTVTFNTIIVPTGANTCSGIAGARYEAVQEVIGGEHVSICEDDWSEFMENVGIRAAGGNIFYLSQAPVVNTIEVVVTTESGESYDLFRNDHWRYEARQNAISIHAGLPRDADVTVYYTRIDSIPDLWDAIAPVDTAMDDTP